ncbi:MAG: hypothetical protein NZL96_03135 [Patescibacteria group bacterium]|nr:hypothetical protein [Patescibacteria group bacterium]
MRKRAINLIVNREDYQKYEYGFKLIRYLTIALFLIILSFFFLIMFILENFNAKIETLRKKKIELLADSNRNQEYRVKIAYLINHYYKLKDFLKNDANSFFYYSLLNQTLKATSDSQVMIREFSINKDRQFNFVVSFADFESLRNFFRFIESKEFLKNFESITLREFLVIGKTERDEGKFQLSFHGQFLPKEVLERDVNNDEN